jgi:hypothetical protein
MAMKMRLYTTDKPLPKKGRLFNREWARIYANEKYSRSLALIRGLRMFDPKAQIST